MTFLSLLTDRPHLWARMFCAWSSSKRCHNDSFCCYVAHILLTFQQWTQSIAILAYDFCTKFTPAHTYCVHHIWPLLMVVTRDNRRTTTRDNMEQQPVELIRYTINFTTIIWSSKQALYECYIVVKVRHDKTLYLWVINFRQWTA